MEVLAVIPARGGSQRVHRKNMQDLGGKPLLWWTVRAAKDSTAITRVVVSTEDIEIAAWCQRNDVETVPQPLENALTGKMSSGVVIGALKFLELAEGYVSDIVCLLHPTSPFRGARHISEAYNRLLAEERRGSVLCYTNDVENGAILLKNTRDFLKHGSFMTGGPIWPLKMNDVAGLDINTWADLERARKLVADGDVPQ